jgi:cob(I)alamin adenosyltransferase
MGEVAVSAEDAPKYRVSKFEKLTPADLALVDAEIARIEPALSPLRGWATPGSSAYPSFLDQARTVARRAERSLVGLNLAGSMDNRLILQYINRVSDLLWLLAREADKLNA